MENRMCLKFKIRLCNLAQICYGIKKSIIFMAAHFKRRLPDWAAIARSNRPLTDPLIQTERDKLGGEETRPLFFIRCVPEVIWCGWTSGFHSATRPSFLRTDVPEITIWSDIYVTVTYGTDHIAVSSVFRRLQLTFWWDLGVTPHGTFSDCPTP